MYGSSIRELRIDASWKQNLNINNLAYALCKFEYPRGPLFSRFTPPVQVTCGLVFGRHQILEKKHIPMKSNSCRQTLTTSSLFALSNFHYIHSVRLSKSFQCKRNDQRSFSNRQNANTHIPTLTRVMCGVTCAPTVYWSLCVFKWVYSRTAYVMSIYLDGTSQPYAI